MFQGWEGFQGVTSVTELGVRMLLAKKVFCHRTATMEVTLLILQPHGLGSQWPLWLMSFAGTH